MISSFHDINKVIVSYCGNRKFKEEHLISFFAMEIRQYFQGKRKWEDISLETQDILKLSIKKGKKHA